MRRGSFLGVAIMLASAFMFAVPGAVAKPLYAIGWTPGAVVLVRLAGSALLLLVPTMWLLRGQWANVRRNWRVVVAYGLTAMAGAQAFYFLALNHMSVAVSILLEMTIAPILVVLWVWLRQHQKPALLTVIGAAIAFIGVLFVLNIRDATWSTAGMLFIVAASVCIAAYFIISANDRVGIDPVAFTGLGMLVGAGTIALVTLTPLMPARFGFGDATLAGRTVAWWVPAVLLVVFTVGAYVCGIISVRMLGATVGSFVNLTEIPFAAIAAWIVVGEALTGWQGIGGAIMLAGIVLVKLGDMKVAPVNSDPIETGGIPIQKL